MTVDNFIPVLWSDIFLTRLKKSLIYSNCFNTDYEGEIKNVGDTVRIGTVGPVTISSYTKNTINLTPELIQTDMQSMSIGQADYFYFSLDDVDKAQAMKGVMEKAMDEAAYGMKNKIDQYLAATLLVGSLNSTTTLPSGSSVSSTSNPIVVGTNSGDTNAYELFTDLSTQLNLQNVPAGDRYCVIDPNFVGKLLKDVRFTSFATAGALETIRQGSSAGGEGQDGALASVLKMLLGMDVYISNNVPVYAAAGSTAYVTPTSTSVYAIIAGYKGAATWANQIPDGQPEAYRLQTGFADAVRGLHLYDGKVTRPAALAGAYVQYS